MIFRSKHALGIHASSAGVSAVWISSRADQPPQCHRTWQIEADSFSAEALPQLTPTPAWPRTSALAVALEDAVVHCADLHLPAQLSWRDRRFQQALEMSLQHPELGHDVVVDDDAQGRVCAISQSVLAHWQSQARSMQCRLQWLGMRTSLDAIQIDSEGDWRWTQAATQAPLALKAALLALRMGQAETADEVQAQRPNWAQSPWQHWLAHARQQTFASCRHAWAATGMNTRRAAWSAGGGALLMVAGMHGLQALGDAREAMTHTSTQWAQLQTQHRELLSAQQTRQAQHAAHARDQQVLQPFVAQGQLSEQWLRVLTQAQGVWLHELRVQSAHLSVRMSDREDKPPLHWQLRGEALSPAQAQALRQALQALQGWRKPPTETQGRWQYGQEGRLAVWAFVLEAELPCPC